MSAANGPAIASEPVGRRGIRLPLLCVIASLACVHAGLGWGLLIGGTIRGDEFLQIAIFVVLYFFVGPGVLAGTLSGIALIRTLRRHGRELTRKRFLAVGLGVMAAAACLALTPPWYWHSIVFPAAVCVLIIAGAVTLLLQAQRG